MSRFGLLGLGLVGLSTPSLSDEIPLPKEEGLSQAADQQVTYEEKFANIVEGLKDSLRFHLPALNFQTTRGERNPDYIHISACTTSGRITVSASDIQTKSPQHAFSVLVYFQAPIQEEPLEWEVQTHPNACKDNTQFYEVPSHEPIQINGNTIKELTPQIQKAVVQILWRFGQEPQF